MNAIPMRRFVAQQKIRMTADWADSNPSMADDDWAMGASHYRCTFKRGRKQMTCYFSMGPAHTEEPTAEEVLDCLANDASGIENARSFEDWCSDYGYDTDSRKAEKIFNTCNAQAKKLGAFLGDAYETLLWKTERL